MSALALALALSAQQPQAQPPAPSWYHAWRLVETDRLHIGVRPAGYVDVVAGQVQEVAVGVTVQLTTFVPW